MFSAAIVVIFVFILVCCLSEMLAFTSLARRGMFPAVRPTRTRASFHTNGVSCAAKLLPGDIGGVRTAAEEIRNGKLVAFPTETVYGLGANAFNAEAVQAIFTTKQRPNSDPLIVHVSNARMMNDLYDFSNAVDAAKVCRTLTSSFWPGPLTIIFKAHEKVPSVITAGTGFVGVRCPKHQVALTLIHEAGVPIAAPSANRFGHVSPTSAAHVMDDLGHSDISILSDNTSVTGGCSVGVESTVCRISANGRQVSVLRCGAVTVNMLQEVLGEECEVIVDNERHLHTSGTTAQSTHTTDSSDAVEAPVAPGQMLKHYAPDIPTYIVRDVHTLIRTSTTGTDSNTTESTTIDSTTVTTNTTHTTPSIHTAMVIDYAGQLAPLQHLCKHYIDLSATGSAEEACFRLFDVLRSSESAETASMGVTHVLLPDLSVGSDSKSNSEGSGSSSTSGSSSGTSGSRDGLLSALWERLHRAASGTYV